MDLSKLLRDYKKEPLKIIKRKFETPLKEDIIELYITQNLKKKEIAEYFGVSESVLKGFLREYNISKPKINIPRDKLKELYIDKNMSRDEVAEYFGVNSTTITVYCRKYNIPHKSEKQKYQIRVKTVKRKYGVENQFQREEIKNKSKETCLEKYGKEYYQSTDEYEIKVKQTKLKRYGNENYNNYEKYISTCIEKYNKDNFSKKDEKDYEYNLLGNKDELIKYIKDNKIGNCKELALTLDMRPKTVQLAVKKYNIRQLFDYRKSLKEKQIHELIPEYLNPEYNYLFNGHKELDIYIPSLKMGIEFDGNYWHSEEIKGRYAQYNKTNAARKMGIDVFHIYEWEWDNYKNYIIDSLKRLFDTSTYKIEASKCKLNIMEYNKRIKYDIINFERIWLSIIFVNDNNNYTIENITFGSECKVYNGIKYILDDFIKKYNPKSIRYKSDESKMDNVEIIDYGFKFHKQYKPDYVYVNNKRMVVLKNQIDEEEAKKLNYFKLYNCGYVEYLWENDNFTF